jgi:NAD(P)-dependent dehydrogenase (short-subunit alcohol dehydrogenase family)
LENRAKAADVDLDIVHKIDDTNVFGVIASTQAMLPLLRKSPNACIVNMSSSLGSLGSLQTPMHFGRNMCCSATRGMTIGRSASEVAARSSSKPTVVQQRQDLGIQIDRQEKTSNATS